MHLYFGYGSNLDTEQMKERCSEAKIIGPGCLNDYRLDFTWYSSGWECGVADVVADSGSSVWGLVYKITDQNLRSLDRHEGYPDIYTRFPVTVKCSNSWLSDVWVYAVVNKHNFIAPSRDYLTIIKIAAKRHSFPKSYRSYLNTIKTSEEQSV